MKIVILTGVKGALYCLYEPRHAKTGFSHMRICENKDADQLRGYHEADQHLCFRYKNSSIPLLRKSKI